MLSRGEAVAIALIATIATAMGLIYIINQDRPPTTYPHVRVLDGDTFELRHGERVRISNIQCPELHWDTGFDVDALIARDRLRELAANGVTLEREGTDRYDRTLALVSANGTDVGETLIEEGLCRPWYE